jgi:hypothetical protein
MSEPMHRSDRDELLELYSELHLTCARAASALRLAEHWDAPEEELLARFRKEEARATTIWKRILELR